MSGEYNDSMINELTPFFLRREGWTTWTPTVTQGVGITVAITYARYIILAKTVLVRARIGLTSAGTAAQSIVIGGVPSVIYPANVGGVDYVLGGAVYHDAGTAYYHAALVALGNSDWRLICNASNNYFGANPAVTVANGDVIGLFATYERV